MFLGKWETLNTEHTERTLADDESRDGAQKLGILKIAHLKFLPTCLKGVLIDDFTCSVYI